jgi:hypothetical protein
MLLLTTAAAAESPLCPSYHPVRASNVYDPSGPILDQAGTTWHTWEDAGSWFTLDFERFILWDEFYNVNRLPWRYRKRLAQPLR